jgi:RNA-directed DNA polymerase
MSAKDLARTAEKIGQKKESKMKEVRLPLKIQTDNLFDELCLRENLNRGFRAVRRNDGAAGIDGISTEEFETNLEFEIQRIIMELQGWTYKPHPVKRVEIPTPDGGVRNLGIPCVRDRVVQATVKMLLEPIYEAQFSDNSYGFRPGRNQRQAVEAAQKIVASGKEHVVDIDLSKFFDRINHDRLVARLGQSITDKRMLRLIGITLRSGVMENGLVSPTFEGSVQGSPLSPLLSNVVLDELDKELEERGLEFCRFADDCNIFVGTTKAAERVMESISKYIENKLKLMINRDKSKVGLSKEVKFLGMTIIEKTISISKKSYDRAMAKVKELTPRGTSLTLRATMDKINSWYMGWSSYYSMTQYPSQLKHIEAHIRRRLRARIVDQHKKRRNLYAKLVRNGIPKRTAKVVYTNKGRWVLSHTYAVEKAFSNEWFRKVIGQKIRSNEKHSHWFDLSKWVKFV